MIGFCLVESGCIFWLTEKSYTTSVPWTAHQSDMKLRTKYIKPDTRAIYKYLFALVLSRSKVDCYRNGLMCIMLWKDRDKRNRCLNYLKQKIRCISCKLHLYYIFLSIQPFCLHTPYLCTLYTLLFIPDYSSKYGLG